ncbi:MAG: hypothetical protein EP330_07055 [Deltaproteobacteria bacterium]|nr:MAG: hypothetical protein EP330_07055 [Deltaproteobacteria bacterium]
MRFALFLMLAGCPAPTAPEATPEAAVPAVAEPATLPTEREASEPQPDAPVLPKPESATALESMLMAQHSEDLPDKAKLDTVDGAAAGLAWLADFGDPLVLRARALDLLGYYPPGAEQLRTTARESSLPKLQAAALFGLARTDLAADPQGRELARTLARHSDERVAMAAVAALKTVPEEAAFLAELAADEAVMAPVREAAAE